MLLNNYYNLYEASTYLYRTPSNYYPSGSFVAGAPTLQLKQDDGNYADITPDMCGAQGIADKLSGYFQQTPPSVSNVFATKAPTTGANNYKTYIAFGSGTTPPTLDDYTVEEFIDNIAPTATRVISIENGKRIYFTFTNNNEYTINISEVVVYGNIAAYMYETKLGALLREVFPIPITVEAGESFIFSWDYVSG